MPTIVRYLGYNIYIWSDESNPVEPIHVHAAKTPTRNADKFWLTKEGLIIPDSKNRMLSKSDTAKIISYLSDEYIQMDIKSEWLKRFGVIKYKE